MTKTKEAFLKEINDLKKQIEILKGEIVQLKLENAELEKKNARGAGRKKTIPIEERNKIRELYKTGMYSLADIAKRYSVSRITIHNIVNKEIVDVNKKD